MLCTYLLLFNCQGSIASTFFRVESFVIISHLFHFVNTFLKSFFEFFSWFLTSCFFVIAVRFAHNSLIISHSIPFVNTFLKSFLKSFFKPFPLSLIDRDVCFISSRAQHSLTIIAPREQKVNTFFRFFSTSCLTTKCHKFKSSNW